MKPGKKRQKKLERRRRDYSAMVNGEKGEGQNYKNNPLGYHRPGGYK